MKYTEAEMNIVLFETEDVIATSYTDTTGATTPSYLDPSDSIGGEVG